MELPQTAHSTSMNGSTISLNFIGAQIDVLGVIPTGQGPLTANYTIDNGEPRSRSIPTLLQNTSIEYQTLFLSDILDMGNHTIVIDIVGTGVDRNYTFQQFKVTAPANDPGKSIDMSMNGGGGGDDGGGDGDSGNKGGDKNGDDNSNNHGSKGKSNQDLNTAAIVGGILGSVIFLILVFFGAFLFWRRRRLGRISNNGQNHLPPMIYYAQSIPDGSPRGQGLYMVRPGSYLDTDSKFTFPVHREAVDGSRQSWVPVDMPPSIPGSAVLDDHRFSDWSSYKGSSLVVQQSHAERSHFSPYTTTTFSPMAFREPTPPPAPRRTFKPPLQIDTLTRTSKSSLILDGTAF